MRSPFDDLDPDDDRGDVAAERGVPPLDDEPVAPSDPAPADRLRRPRLSAPQTPVDRRPRREEISRAEETRARERERRGEAGGFRAFLRGLTRRCPRCGVGGLFETWFRIRERCPRCGFRLEREEGGFLGAMTINYAVTALVWVVVFVAWLVVDLPDVHVLQLTFISLAIAIVVPLLFWPFSKTLWSVVDYLVTQSEVSHVPEDVRPPDH